MDTASILDAPFGREHRKMKEPINKVVLKDGKTRYRLVVDAGRDENGKRKQVTRTFDTHREAREELSRVRHETNLGSYVRPSKETMNAYLDGYLKGATRGRRASTKRNYEDAFRPVRERLGTRPLQSIAKADVEDLIDWMLTSGRRRGGKPGTGLSGRTARLTLGRLTAALETAVLEGKLVRNVARLVTPPEHVQRERETWSQAEVRKFIAKASKDRLHAAWRLSLYGLRRGEVLGLRWSDIDLRARTLTVRQARVLVEYRVLIEEPKSRNGRRTLPLDDELVAALTALRKVQARESEDAGTLYRAGLSALDWYQGGEYVITDELGMPVHPEWYSDEFGRLLRRAGLRRITLHDSRHTTLTLMEHAGVPISIISKWAGHYDSAFTQKTYVHASDEDLQRGRTALAKIHKIA
jgi:integrase